MLLNSFGHSWVFHVHLKKICALDISCFPICLEGSEPESH